jgi:C6 transcription factor Pro1
VPSHNIQSRELPSKATDSTATTMSGTKSWSGCWTCRLRHKKCDEEYPQCMTCSSLLITCHYSREKPPWMDNGPGQEEMVEKLKQEVKEKAALRRSLGYIREAQTANSELRTPAWMTGRVDTGADTQYDLPYQDPSPANLSMSATSNSALPNVDSRQPKLQPGPQPRSQRVWPGCDPGFKSYYLDYFFPFLFPFYQPHMLEGGRSWLLEFVNEATGMQHTAIALSSYLFSIVLDSSEGGHEICKKIGWDKLFAEMEDTFTRLKNDIVQLSQGSDHTDSQLSLASRILGTIVHLQRFEIATQGFANCNRHLSAAVQCFEQILNRHFATPKTDARADFYAVMERLGPSPWPRPYRQFQIASSEQVAFRFFVSLLVADDIIASTFLAEEPRLYKYHKGLLAYGLEGELPVDLEAVIGCQNWIMEQIGEISALAAWKRRRLVGQNDLGPEVARRSDVIRNALQSRLKPMVNSQDTRPALESSDEGHGLLNLFQSWQFQPGMPASESKVVSCIWALAALIYLSVTEHGWDPTHHEIRRHVAHVIELLANRLSNPALLRTVAWPFCVAGCLAEAEQESFFRHRVESLQPAQLFVTIRKAMDIVERVWLERGTVEPKDRKVDMASCFGDMCQILFLV